MTESDRAGLSLPTVKDFLNSSTTVKDSLLALTLQSAEEMWLSRGGPLAAGDPTTEWHDGGNTVVSLYHAPVASVVSVDETIGTIDYPLHEYDPGSSGDAWAYSLSTGTGTITRRASGMATPFADGERNINRTLHTSPSPRD